MIKTWAFTALDLGSIPGQGTKSPQATWCRGKKKKTHKNPTFYQFSFKWREAWDSWSELEHSTLVPDEGGGPQEE